MLGKLTHEPLSFNGSSEPENDFPRMRVLNTTSMQWVDLCCAPSALRAVLDLGMAPPEHPGQNLETRRASRKRRQPSHS